MAHIFRGMILCCLLLAGCQVANLEQTGTVTQVRENGSTDLYMFQCTATVQYDSSGQVVRIIAVDSKEVCVIWQRDHEPITYFKHKKHE